jgi:uncharacterized protein (DUF1330 family)
MAMTAYFVIDLDIPDPQKLAEYEAAANPLAPQARSQGPDTGHR